MFLALPFTKKKLQGRKMHYIVDEPGAPPTNRARKRIRAHP
jgi:hypothetical protein